jgi:hypothetical protein
VEDGLGTEPNNFDTGIVSNRHKLFTRPAPIVARFVLETWGALLPK